MRPIPLIHNDDLYRIYVDEVFHDIIKIELYPDNRNVKAEEIEYSTLDAGLRQKITNKLIKQYGISPTIPVHDMSRTSGRDGSSGEE